jgi:hypothetical protein
LPSTSKELIENYGFATEDILQEIQDITEENSVVRSFYESTIIEPIVKPIQLGITVGKRFSFKKFSRFSINPELTYHYNLTTRTTFQSDSFVGNIIITNFIEPNLDPSTSLSFDTFNFPSLIIRFTYQMGEKIQQEK